MGKNRSDVTRLIVNKYILLGTTFQLIKQNYNCITLFLIRLIMNSIFHWKLHLNYYNKIVVENPIVLYIIT